VENADFDIIADSIFDYNWCETVCCGDSVNDMRSIFSNIFGGWWRWALVSPDGVAPSRMVCVSASVNLPLHHEVQKLSSGTGSQGGPGKRAVKRL